MIVKWFSEEEFTEKALKIREKIAQGLKDEEEYKVMSLEEYEESSC